MFDVTVKREISPGLRKFLTDWLDWVERGAPEKQPYRRHHGLCVASMHAPGISWKDTEELNAIFGILLAPFGPDFWDRMTDRTMHECPVRLAWVRLQLGIDGPPARTP